MTEALPKLRSMWKGPSRPTVDMEGGPSRPTVDMEGIVVLTRYNFSIETDVKFTFASTGSGHWGGVVGFHPAILSFPLPY